MEKDKLSLAIVNVMQKEADGMLLTSDEAADLLNLPTHRIRIMIHLKQLSAAKVGHQWRIPRNELTKLIALIALYSRAP